MTLFEIRDQALSVDEVTQAVAHPSAGGTTLFIGTVRDENDGQPITLLEYEAYTSMAVKEMRAIGDQIAHEIPGARLAVLHRVGRLSVGDLAVVCAASAPHRDEAFRACRLLIDRIKERVPIWKCEHGPDGPYWVGFRDARCTGHHNHVD